MPDLPITNGPLYDFVLIGIVVILGVALALKADKPWAWILVIVAGVWAFKLLRVMDLI